MQGLQDKDAKWMANKLGFIGDLQGQVQGQIHSIICLFFSVS